MGGEQQQLSVVGKLKQLRKGYDEQSQQKTEDLPSVGGSEAPKRLFFTLRITLKK